MSISFFKYSGHGNDFVIIDSWDSQPAEQDLPKLARLISRRKYGVGADGVVFISEGPHDVDFAVRFFNSDGSEADMCGNASRCAAHLAHTNHIAPVEMTFKTKAGDIRARVEGDYVSVRLPKIGRPDGVAMIDVDGFSRTYHRINTGVNHAVTWVDDLDRLDVVKYGRFIRRHPSFSPGANVDFVRIVDRDTIDVRTYEIGVEDETLACGTGVTASALLSLAEGYVEGENIHCRTRGGEELNVRVVGGEGEHREVSLEGKVRFVFSGALAQDALKAEPQRR
ncbi:MAG: diaminopimelate epimerase [Deltaproteobacteria bacterium]|jgi:diaminopimelate epimerase|nr:diaminopimelate epimerase [Deltaproteobacteria bacterium]